MVRRRRNEVGRRSEILVAGEDFGSSLNTSGPVNGIDVKKVRIHIGRSCTVSAYFVNADWSGEFGSEIPLTNQR